MLGFSARMPTSSVIRFRMAMHSLIRSDCGFSVLDIPCSGRLLLLCQMTAYTWIIAMFDKTLFVFRGLTLGSLDSNSGRTEDIRYESARNGGT